MTTDQKQILVSENDSYVLPKPPRGPRAQLVVDQETATPPTARAERGEEPIDLSELCEEVAAVRPEPSSPISVITRQPAICWGERARIVHLVQKALDLVWARTEQQGLRRLEISWREDAACVRVSSQGEPVDGVDPELVDAFRAAAAGADVTVEPDALGPAGAGMLLVLPRD